jgi:excisionase family DNA binding protein
MESDITIPDIPGYVSIEGAAKMLGLAKKTVYEYVAEGRIPAVRAGRILMIQLEEVQKFRPNIAGRPRKSIPSWRISPRENVLLSTLVTVSIKAGQQENFKKVLEQIRQERRHTFPGTVARYIISNDVERKKVHMVLIWRSAMISSESDREKQLEAFRQELCDVLDWGTAQYDTGEVFMHT